MHFSRSFVHVLMARIVTDGDATAYFARRYRALTQAHVEHLVVCAAEASVARADGLDAAKDAQASAHALEQSWSTAEHHEASLCF